VQHTKSFDISVLFFLNRWKKTYELDCFNIFKSNDASSGTKISQNLKVLKSLHKLQLGDHTYAEMILRHTMGVTIHLIKDLKTALIIMLARLATVLTIALPRLTKSLSLTTVLTSDLRTAG